MSPCLDKGHFGTRFAAVRKSIMCHPTVNALSSFGYWSLCEKYTKSSSCLTENTLHLHYKQTLFNAIFGNNRYLLWQPWAASIAVCVCVQNAQSQTVHKATAVPQSARHKLNNCQLHATLITDIGMIVRVVLRQFAQLRHTQFVWRRRRRRGGEENSLALKNLTTILCKLYLQLLLCAGVKLGL